MPRARSIAEEYHRLTKYSARTLATGPGLDWSRQPRQFKDIVSSQRVSLRSFLPQGKLAAPKQREGEHLGLARIGRLLFYSYGVTGVIRYENGGSQLLRAAPSAGALYPTEVYIALRDMDGAEAGLYNYQVRSHELVRLWEGDQMDTIRDACGGDPVFDEAEACVLMTGIHWRSAWRYQERGYRRVLLDTGHVAANMVSYAAHESCTAHPIQGFCDGALNGLFFFDDSVEGMLVAVPLLEGERALEPAPLWVSAPCEVPPLEPVEIRAQEDLKSSVSVALHRASSCGERREAQVSGSPPRISKEAIRLAEPASINANIPNAIVQRRSARSFTGEQVSVGDLGQALGYAFGRNAGARYATREAGLMNAHVVVHDVDGLERGLYAVEGAGEALKPIRLADLREECFRLALGQEIARSCSAILVFSSPAKKSVAAWGDRAYRHLHLEAGMAGERLQLGAGALGLGACGIGGFFDDDAARLVGVEVDDFVIYMVTIGHI